MAKCVDCKRRLDKQYVFITGKNLCQSCIDKRNTTPEEKLLVKKRRRTTIIFLCICITLMIVGWILLYLKKIGKI